MKARTRFFTSLLVGSALAVSLNAASQLPDIRKPDPAMLSPLLTPAALEALHLNPGQQRQLGRIRQANAYLAKQIRSEFLATRIILEAELEREQPDLRRVTTRSAQARKHILAAWQRGIEARLAFYETLDPEQKIRIRDALKERLVRFDQLRKLLIHLFGAPKG